MMRSVVLALLLAVTLKSFVGASIDELDSIIGDLEDTPTEKPATNPCEEHVCGWGKECVVDKKHRPVCECIAKCPELDNDPQDQVCASNNQTFPSLCELYRQRCLCKKRNAVGCESPAYAKVHLE